MKLENRTILIAGDMGFELAKRLLERRNVVIITGRSHEKLESAKRALSARWSDSGVTPVVAKMFRKLDDRWHARLVRSTNFCRNWLHKRSI